MQKMRYSVVEGLPKNGLKPIKEVEMWSKWGPLITNEDDFTKLCPNISDTVIVIVKEDNIYKAEKGQ